MRYITKIVLLLSFSFVVLFANLPNINECKTDLYYANGIMMKDSKKKAKIKWNVKVNLLFVNDQETLNKLGEIDISYNKSQTFVDDIYESFEQVMSNEWGWYEFSQYYRTYMEQTGFQTPDNTHTLNLDTQVSAYKKSIKDGHGVIVIAHSQGNYFTNEAYELLDPWMKEYFHMMGVATPANHVAGYPVGDTTAPYVKLHNDFINIVVTGLDSNRDNPNTEHSSVASVAAHDFYESYLTAENTKINIFNFILEKIQAHSNAPSQWETDEELNKNTEHYCITVKHKYDSSVTMSEEVYPFAPSQKLYYVDGNISGYVKASCGGYLIEDTWTGQDIATQAAKLSYYATPHEIIEYKCDEGYTYNLGSGLCEQNTPVSIYGFISGHMTHRDDGLEGCSSNDWIQPDSEEYFIGVSNGICINGGYSQPYSNFRGDFQAYSAHLCANYNLMFDEANGALYSYLNNILVSYSISYGEKIAEDCDGGYPRQSYIVTNAIPK